MTEIGIEQARKALGEIADRARYARQTTYLTRNGKRIAAIVPLEDTMTTTFTAYLVRGNQPGAHAMDLADSPLENRPDVLAWAEDNGLSDDDPDVYVMVAPADERVEPFDLIATHDFDTAR